MGETLDARRLMAAKSALRSPNPLVDGRRLTIREATAAEVEDFAIRAEPEGMHLVCDSPAPGEETTFYVACVDGWAVGIGGIMRRRDGARIRGAWVARPYRRAGLWWALVEHRIAVAREWGVPYVETWAVHPGPLLRNGWRVASERHRNGAVHVRHDLAAAPAPGAAAHQEAPWVATDVVAEACAAVCESREASLMEQFRVEGTGLVAGGEAGKCAAAVRSCYRRHLPPSHPAHNDPAAPLFGEPHEVVALNPEADHG